jgi:hypothetical protein
MPQKYIRPILPLADIEPLIDGVRVGSEALIAFYSQLFKQQVQEQRARREEGLRQLNEFLTCLGRAVLHTLSEANIASQDIAGPLKHAGFWVPPSAPMSLILQLRDLVREGPPDPGRLRQTIADFYDAGDASHLRNMVSAWSANPSLAQHQQVIQDALEAHVAGKYTLCIPSLLPVLEHLLTDLHGAYIPGHKMPKTACKHIASSYTDFMREASKDAVVNYITGSGLFGSVPNQHFTVDAFPKWLASQGLTERDVVNRHAILHGVQVDYAGKENSLRVFLLLDVLSWLTRKDWDKRLKIILEQRQTGEDLQDRNTIDMPAVGLQRATFKRGPKAKGDGPERLALEE